MAGFIAVVRREVRTAFVTPLGWSVLAAFAALAGAVFALTAFASGAPATLRGVFIAMGWAVLATAPALGMRSVAEERRHGTWPALLAAPGGATAALAGKFVAATAFLGLAVAVPTVAQLLALEVFSRPDYGEAATAVLGLVLAGAAYIACSILMSAVSGNQVGAYLLSVFLWLTWIVLAKAAPAVVPARAAYAAFALDPLRRLDEFLLGLLDTGNVAFFTAVAAWFLAAAMVVVTRPLLPAARAGWMRAGLTLVAGAGVALGAAGLLNAPGARGVLDMTKTRAYTLADSTRELLAGLDGEWRVAVALASAGADPAVVRQVDEVLARMEEAAPGRVRTLRVDPTDPADAARYEELLDAVAQRDAPAAARHDEALRAGLAAFDRLAALAVAEQERLAGVLRALPADGPDRAELDTLRGAFAQLTAQKGAFDRSIRDLRTASDARPFPDRARAAHAVAANLQHWGELLQDAARALSQRQRERVDQAALAAWLEGAVPQYMETARTLRAAQDGLERLPPLHGAAVGAALAAGDATIVLGPPGVAVIPGWQLVAGGGTDARAAVAFDRRFRGEQILAAAVRGLRGGEMPVAVVVHAGAPGALRARPDHVDFAAVADALASARIEVREWIPGEGPEPLAPPGRALVWIVAPPSDRDSTGESPRERALLQAVQRLAARGEPLLLSMGPSLLPLIGQPDPWAAVAAGRGVEARTGRSILEVVPVGPNRAQTVAEQTVRDFESAHVVGSAVDGRLLRLDRVVPLEPRAPGAVVLAAVEPSASRWIENDWRRDQRQRLEAPEGKALAGPVPVVVAVDASGPGAAKPAGAAVPERPVRTLVVGSPTWLLSTTADAADALGGGRVALRYPGNRELLVNAVAWLAGRDDLVAGAGTGREVSRLPRLTRGTRLGVALAEAVGVPAFLALAGAGIVLRRRWRT
jgi:ABC-2 type transport system permease protein